MAVQVVSGGGIFIKDVVGARNYEKWFKLFTPSGSAQGGYVRLTLDFESKWLVVGQELI